MHGINRRFEQDKALHPVGIDHKIGWPVLDMQPLGGTEKAGLKASWQWRVHLRRLCRRGSGQCARPDPECAHRPRIRCHP